MSEKPVLLPESQGLVFDLAQYSFAKDVLKSHPRIITIYQKLLPALYHYHQYQCVGPVIQIVEDSQLLAEMQYRFFKKIYDSKGLVKK